MGDDQRHRRRTVAPDVHEVYRDVVQRHPEVGIRVDRFFVAAQS
jgi:hypothetical protein